MLSRVRSGLRGFRLGFSDGFQNLAIAARQAGTTEIMLLERLAELEFAIEDQGWQRIDATQGREFSRDGLQKIFEACRIYYLKNPLIRRGVECVADYVFGQGVSVTARNEVVNEVIQEFWVAPENQIELTSQEALMLKEADLQVLGNVFLASFSDRETTGRTVVRSIPAEQVMEILCDPEDDKRPEMYRRVWNDGRNRREAWYPAWNFEPLQAVLNRVPIDSAVRIIHIKCGGLSDMRFGVPPIYPGLSWAQAYKGFLENWATIQQGHARWAATLTTAGGKKAVATLRDQLATTLGGLAGSSETNPPPTTASIAIMAEGMKLEPFKTAGSYEPAEGGRRLLLMVCAALGLPESFFGDVSVGTLATARSLDRPTELKMMRRQAQWRDVIQLVCQLVIEASASAPQGKLQKFAGPSPGEWKIDPETGKPLDVHVDVMFPPILEHDTSARVGAVVSAATLDGKPLANVIDRQTVSRELYAALSVHDADELLKKLYPEDGSGPEEASGDEVAEALRGVTAALREARI